MKTEEKNLNELLDLQNELTEQDLDQLKGGTNDNLATAAEDKTQDVDYGTKRCCNTSW